MTGSILVLLVLQILWLRSVYKDYQTGFKQEANLLFKNTVTEMLDSMMVKDLRPAIFQTFPTDSASWTGQIDDGNSGDSIKVFHLEVQRIQESPTRIEMIKPDSIKQIRIITNGRSLNVDSLKATLRPMMQKIDTLQSANKFIFRINDENIDTESITIKFNQKLQKNGFPPQSKVRKAFRMADFDSLDKEILTLDEVPIPPGLRIQPYFENLNGYLFDNERFA